MAGVGRAEGSAAHRIADGLGMVNRRRTATGHLGGLSAQEGRIAQGEGFHKLSVRAVRPSGALLGQSR